MDVGSMIDFCWRIRQFDMPKVGMGMKHLLGFCAFQGI